MTNSNKPLHVAVTGANGLIGQGLTPYLHANGFTVTTLTRKPFPSELWRNIELGTSGLKSLKPSDLSDIDAVVHLAAQVHNRRATWQDYYEANVEQTEALLRGIKGSSVKLIIYTSSVKAVGEYTTDRPFDKDTVPDPKTDYGRTKLAAEKLIQNCCKQLNVAYIIFRLPILVTRNIKGNLGLVNRALASHIPLPLAICSNRRDALSPPNLNNAVHRALLTPPHNCKLFYLSDGRSLSTAELTKKIAKLKGYEPILFHLPDWLLRAGLHGTGNGDWYTSVSSNLEVDITDTISELKWNPDS